MLTTPCPFLQTCLNQMLRDGYSAFEIPLSIRTSLKLNPVPLTSFIFPQVCYLYNLTWLNVWLHLISLDVLMSALNIPRINWPIAPLLLRSIWFVNPLISVLWNIILSSPAFVVELYHHLDYYLEQVAARDLV